MIQHLALAASTANQDRRPNKEGAGKSIGFIDYDLPYDGTCTELTYWAAIEKLIERW